MPRSRLSGAVPTFPLILAAAALAGWLHLQLVVPTGILLASHGFWQFPPGDIAFNVLGTESFLRDRSWFFPFAVTSGLLSNGQQVSIVFTDSAPWIAILAKLLGEDELSVMGMSLALSFILQPVAFVTLLWTLGVRRLEALAIGSLLGSLLPAWYMRMGMHIALSSHWLLLFALALAVSAIRRGVSWWIIVGLTALGALSFGIHIYLFAMVAAISVGALLADVARSGVKEAPKALAGLGLFLATAALSAWVLLSGPSGGVRGFGHFSMNLLSPIFPQRSGIAEILTGHSGRIIDGTSGQYEGFNYLGAGILLCVFAASWTFVRSKPSIRGMRPAAPLIAILVALTGFAVSNRILVGQFLLADIPVPDFALASLSPLRSSGRMFWPVAYLGLACAVAILDRHPNRILSVSILAIGLSAQIVDTTALRRALSTQYDATTTPAVDIRPFSTGDDLRFLPAYSCTNSQHEAARTIALAVVRSGGVLEDGPVSRFDPAVCNPSEAERELTPLRPGRKIFLQTDSLPGGIVEKARRSGRCTPIGSNLLCSADR